MSSTQSPNMNLTIPGVGTEAGPTWAFDLNTSLTIIDQHTHAPGSGVPITTAAININSNLSLNDYFAVDVGGIVLVPQNVAPDINTIYQSGDDLYFVDGLGNEVQITDNGGIAGSPGSISNLTSPASAAYVSGSSTFVWQSNTNIAANMDAGAYLFRNLSPNSTFAITLQAPAALASNFSITLPTLPLTGLPMILSDAGAISTSQITAAYLADNAVSTAKIDALAVTTAKIAAGAVTVAKIDPAITWNQSQVFDASGTFTVPATVTHVMVAGCGGGGGGGGGAGSAGGVNTAGGGGGGGAAAWSCQIFEVTPGAGIAVVVGAGGAGGAGGGANTDGTSGSDGTSGGFGSNTLLAGRAGAGGRSSANGAAGGIADPRTWLTGGNGGAGSASSGGTAGSGGTDSGGFEGGAGGASGGALGGGGGGGGGGPLAAGGAGGAGTSAAGAAGTAAANNSGAGGGGGGGGRAGNVGGTGRAGGSGRVVVYWAKPV